MSISVLILKFTQRHIESGNCLVRSALPGCGIKALCASVVLMAFGTTATAADVFSPPSSAEQAALAQESRIARLEEMLKASAEEKKVVPVIEEKAPIAVEKDPFASLVLPPPPNQKLISTINTPIIEAEVERVLGKMNGQEIYVLGGVVSKRPVLESVFK